MAITRVGGSWIHKYVSLVADDVTHTYTRAAKPELNLPNGSRCFEMDSDTEYIYDRENDAWEVYVPSSGEGSGGTTDYTQLTNKPSINNVQLSGNKSLADLGAVSDVQINGTSILSNGVANIPNASTDAPGVVKINADRGITLYGTNSLQINAATSGQVKNGGTGMLPLTPYHQHESTFYGLAKAAGDTTQAQSENAVGTYTDQAKSAIRNMLGAGTSDIDDVQINGTSILSNGVANIPITGPNRPGVMIVNEYNGHNIINGILVHKMAATATIKNGTEPNEPIVAKNQHESTFYGLAKAAGDTTMPNSSNAVGTYTEAAKTAIRAMLGVTDSAGGMNVVTLTGTNVTQTAAENTMYKCGELAELTFTAPASGITAVRFSSGSTPTVASFPGVTWLGDFDPDHLIANVTYEINILDGVGVAGWA